VIAARLDVHVGVVSRWRRQFAEEGMSGLADRQRSGRPRVFAAAVVAGSRRWHATPGGPRRALVAVVSGGPGRAGRGGGPGRGRVAVDGAALARSGRDPALAVPVVDLDAPRNPSNSSDALGPWPAEGTVRVIALRLCCLSTSLLASGLSSHHDRRPVR
jgi:Winged helix-turn helix